MFQTEQWFVICPGCNENITKEDTEKGDAAYVLGRVWHLKHLHCKICAMPLTSSGCRASPLDDSTPICIDCYMEIQHPSCYACHLPLRETCVVAMRKKYHHECFRCYKCRGSMPNGQYYLLNGNAFDEDCYFTVKCVRKNNLL
ncbi:LIM domain protein [Dictyocaulus viviparus]|uniref:LIM domain protein n=1 Tax=Dictyocaulus viviparus TaxID=29172 RepID=A0A0D8YA39_DICVI|nr:LIM domain protein [Dictyocaulus viviparus]